MAVPQRTAKAAAVLANRTQLGDFFFQAEDGIRDGTVTGVQTCALPISESGVPTFRDMQTGLWERFDAAQLATPSAFQRSEERRVGKEWRTGWSGLWYKL